MEKEGSLCYTEIGWIQVYLQSFGCQVRFPVSKADQQSLEANAPLLIGIRSA